MNKNLLWKTNRQRFIFELKNIPFKILQYQKGNKKLTAAEKMVSVVLQDCLLLKWIQGVKTQQIIKLGVGNYIMVDFFITKPGLIIEVDGPEHDPLRDKLRDKTLYDLFGYKVIRITNENIQAYNKEVREKILKEIFNASNISAREIKKYIQYYWELKQNGQI